MNCLRCTGLWLHAWDTCHFWSHDSVKYRKQTQLWVGSNFRVDPLALPLFLNVEYLVFESAELLVGYRDCTRFSIPHDLMRAVWSCWEEDFWLQQWDETFVFFVFQVARMTAALLMLLLAGPVTLAAGSPVHFKATNGTIPLVLWHGMGE